jgi:diadenosine tetraphosphate (Ap4A) HIT family hydrolase
MANVLVTSTGGTVQTPVSVFNDRADGGHLVVNPPRTVWERSELAPAELAAWCFLVTATGQAMLEVLPQLKGGCLNYWDAGNWSLNDAGPPPGRKDPREHRQVHMHVFGRNPEAKHPDWRWGEAPRFPEYARYREWAKQFAPLDSGECAAIARRIGELLRDKYRG